MGNDILYLDTRGWCQVIAPRHAYLSLRDFAEDFASVAGAAAGEQAEVCPGSDGSSFYVSVGERRNAYITTYHGPYPWEVKKGEYSYEVIEQRPAVSDKKDVELRKRVMEEFFASARKKSRAARIKWKTYQPMSEHA